MEGTYRILLVEDSDTQALKTQLLVEGQGWQIARVTTAEQALEGLRRVAPDLLVVDFHLPGMNGDNLCRHVRMNIDTCNIPVLMLTGDEAAGAELHSLDSGADDFISKSEGEATLLLRMQLLLRKSRRKDAASEHGVAFQRPRLLVIDDSPSYRELLALELGRDGYEVLQAASGEEGLEQLDEHEFDCILVALEMPQMDGVEVCRRLAVRQGDGPITLLLTGREGRQEIARALEAGVDDFVGKEAEIPLLKARIWALLRRKFYQNQQRRIIEEFKAREMETLRAQAEKEAAQAKAAMADELEKANHKLKAAQSQLVQSEKMSSLGQLVAGIAHEINNPLAFVLNNVYTVSRNLERVRDGTTNQASADAVRRLDKACRRIEDMKEGLERVKDLVLKLRTFSRLDEGQFKTIDIHESLESVLLFLKHKMGGRIKVEREYRAAGELSCYAGQLNQVFMNLIANAVDAIEGEGRITISTRQESGTIKIGVKDTGQGIPPGVRERIFEPFFTTKAIGQGTGLGLSISYGIVQAHKGDIEVRSEGGKGTEFIVGIPVGLTD